MLTTNLNVEDRLINGQIETVGKIKYNNTSRKPEIICIKFDDETAGLQDIRKSGDLFARQNQAAPITMFSQKLNEIKVAPLHLRFNKLSFPLHWHGSALFTKFKV